MDNEQVAAMERQMLEEHRKDVEALERLKRFLPSNSSEVTSQEKTVLHQTVTPLIPEEDTPLKYAIRDIMNNDPNVRWTNSKMLNYLENIRFTLNAKRPIYSIGQATQRLLGTEEIKLLIRGAGSTPNVFRGLTDLERTARESAEELEVNLPD